MEEEQIIIAGPCAVEDQKQVETTVRNAKKLGIDTVRLNLWKPRTKPGFDGVKEQGIGWVREAAQEGVHIAMEVLLPEHLELLLTEVLAPVSHCVLIAWIGSRNQNHIIQKAIATIAAQEKRVRLMIKNQPWRDKDHWIGIGQHVLDAGLDQKQLLLCHRGFSAQNPQGFRNCIDIDIALQVQRELGNVPMLLDPSHIGGSIELVAQIATGEESRNFQGQLIEVHPQPETARTDAKQQLTWERFEQLLPLIKRTHL